MKKRSLLFLLPFLGMILAGCGDKPANPSNPGGDQPSEEPGEEPGEEIVHVQSISYVMPNNQYSILVGETLKVGVEVTPDAAQDKSCTFTSSNPEVATINEQGVITGVSAGKTDITITSNDNPEATKTITGFTVVAPAAPLPEKTKSGYGKLAQGESLKYGEIIHFVTASGEDYLGMGTTGGNFILGNELSVEEEKLDTSDISLGYQVVTNDDSTYSFMDINGKYLAAVSGSNYLVGVDEITSLAKFSVEVGVDGRASIVATDPSLDGKARNLVYNSSTPRFSLYKDSTITAASYSKPAIYHNGVELTPGSVATTGVAMKEAEYEVAVGETATVGAWVLPQLAANKEVTYEIIDANPAGCATIEGNVVTGVEPGTAKVKVSQGAFTSEATLNVVGEIATTSVSAIKALEENSTFTMKVVVAGIDGKNVLAYDETGYILVYLNAAGEGELAVGDFVRFKATNKKYNAGWEACPVANTEFVKDTDSTKPTAPAAVAGTVDALDATTDAYACTLYSGVAKVEKNGSYYNAKFRGASEDTFTTKWLRASAGNKAWCAEANAGKQYNVTFALFQFKTDFYGFFLSADELTCNVSIASGIENGEVTIEGLAEGKHAIGEITVVATAAPGYELETLTVTEGQNEPVSIKDTNKFVGEEGKTYVVNATFVQQVGTCSISIASGIENGTVEVSGGESATHAYGEITVTATPASGYELATLTVTDGQNEPVDIKNAGAFTAEANHTYVVNATFSVAVPTTTFSKTTSELVTEHSWEISAGSDIKGSYLEFDLVEDIISVSVVKTGSNQGTIWGTSPNNDYRLYQSGLTSFTISAASGYKLVSVKLTYKPDKNGTLVYNGNNVASDTKVDVDASSILFTVGNTGTATNGQVRISGWEIVYKAA